jgi:hypothetical protein
MPAFRHCSRSCDSTLADMATRGARTPARRMRRAASSPFNTGICRSRKIRSKAPALAATRASAPSAVVTTSQPQRSSSTRANSRFTS